ncbi:hypothetical protein GCM10029963_78450 [Micromonospora andamanensis]
MLLRSELVSSYRPKDAMTPTQPNRAAQATPDPAPETALRAADDFVRRIGKRAGAPVRNVFVSALGDEVPPLAALLRGGGRGGVVRVKLYLSLLWVCAAAPYQASYPARAWAALLGLPDYETKGVRRIHEATRDLMDHQFIVAQDRGGQPSLLTLLDESGAGEIYLPPSDSYNNLAARKAPSTSCNATATSRSPHGSGPTATWPASPGRAWRCCWSYTKSNAAKPDERCGSPPARQRPLQARRIHPHRRAQRTPRPRPRTHPQNRG